ncbi:MAG: iron ABC transporter permease [Proteobacteria bacterium]|nr:iron ABC transporter permease [Pseudomonadota bacterium]
MGADDAAGHRRRRRRRRVLAPARPRGDARRPPPRAARARRAGAARLRPAAAAGGRGAGRGAGRHPGIVSAVPLPARADGDAPQRGPRRWPRARLLAGLALATAAALLLAAGSGAYPIAPGRLLAVLADVAADPVGASSRSADHLVFLQIRAPRLLLAVASGAALGLAGALLQGLFRNPLADPGLVGVASGAALATALAIVAGGSVAPALPRLLGEWTLPVAAFAGALGATALVYALARGGGATRLTAMLLAGIAVNALAAALLGWLSQVATDAQLRALQFWLLGSLGGARWSAVLPAAALIALAATAALRLAPALDALALGEAPAHTLGVPVERVKREAVLWVALAVGAATALTGIVGFVGLVAPHAVRLVGGPGHRTVLPGAALAGAALVLAADAFARTAAAPAELPLGVLTALLGAPCFILLLRRTAR